MSLRLSAVFLAIATLGAPTLANPSDGQRPSHLAQANSPLLLIDFDGKQSSASTADILCRDLSSLLQSGRDGKLLVTFEGQDISIVKNGQNLMVDTGFGPQPETVQSYLLLLEEARNLALEATCHNNQRQIRRALLVWKQDHDGTEPAQLSELTPYYLQTLPQCPFRKGHSKSATYELDAKSSSLRCRFEKKHPHPGSGE